MKTTSKEVITKLQEHILDQFGTDYGWDTDNKVANLTDQISHMRVGSENNYTTAVHLVEGGTFLVYYTDVKEFLNGLGINPDNKEYGDQDSWKLYIHLLAREISKLVNATVYA